MITLIESIPKLCSNGLPTGPESGKSLCGRDE